MRIFSEDSINKLQNLENDYIKKHSSRNSGAGHLDHHENDHSIAQEIGLIDPQGNLADQEMEKFVKPMEELTKNRFKHEFCIDFINNFDEYIETIAKENIMSPQEIADFKGALGNYAVNLNEYNNLCSDKLKNEVINRILNHETDYDQINGFKKDTDGNMIDNLKWSVPLKKSEEMSLSELQGEEHSGIDPFATPEQTQRTIRGSVADFFASVHKFLLTGLTSWWTGVALDKVESIYDIYGSVSPDTVRRQQESEQMTAILDDDEPAIESNEPSKNTVEKTK
jgi:hypothetical protein